MVLRLITELEPCADYPFTWRRRIRIDRCDARSQLMRAGFTTHYPLSPLARGAMKTSRAASTTLERARAAGERRGRTICRTRALDAERRCPQRALCFIPGNCGPDAIHLQTATTTRPTVVDNCAIVASLLATWRLAYKSLSRKLPSAKLEGSNIEPTLLFRQLS